MAWTTPIPEIMIAAKAKRDFMYPSESTGLSRDQQLRQQMEKLKAAKA